VKIQVKQWQTQKAFSAAASSWSLTFFRSQKIGNKEEQLAAKRNKKLPKTRTNDFLWQI
jgi:hypothetical protein